MQTLQDCRGNCLACWVHCWGTISFRPSSIATKSLLNGSVVFHLLRLLSGIQYAKWHACRRNHCFSRPCSCCYSILQVWGDIAASQWGRPQLPADPLVWWSVKRWLYSFLNSSLLVKQPSLPSNVFIGIHACIVAPDFQNVRGCGLHDNPYHRKKPMVWSVGTRDHGVCGSVWRWYKQKSALTNSLHKQKATSR